MTPEQLSLLPDLELKRRIRDLEALAWTADDLDDYCRRLAQLQAADAERQVC